MTISGNLRTAPDAAPAVPAHQVEQTNPAFEGTEFTPHDFRRLFATDLVNYGLPIQRRRRRY